MKTHRRTNPLLHTEDDDPLSVVVNLFDVAMVFAVSLMVAMVMHLNMTEIFGNEDFTIVKNPGTDRMEIITKEGQDITTYTATGQNTTASGLTGKKLGIAYQLEDGRVIYVPED